MNIYKAKMYIVCYIQIVDIEDTYPTRSLVVNISINKPMFTQHNLTKYHWDHRSSMLNVSWPTKHSTWHSQISTTCIITVIISKFNACITMKVQCL